MTVRDADRAAAELLALLNGKPPARRRTPVPAGPPPREPSPRLVEALADKLMPACGHEASAIDRREHARGVARVLIDVWERAL